MKKIIENNNKCKNIVILLVYTTIISYLSIKIYLKIIKLKKEFKKKKKDTFKNIKNDIIKNVELPDLTIAPSPEFILPPSTIKLKNLSYCFQIIHQKINNFQKFQ